MKLTWRYLKTIISLFFAIVLFNRGGYCQSYGLGFKSYEVVQDQRTSLALSLGKLPAGNNIEITFDLSFIPIRQTYFGYIFRLISDDHQNIDMVYDNLANTGHFKIIIGERLSNMSFNIDNQDLFKNWNKLRLLIDYKHNQVSIISGHKRYIESGVHLNPLANYKLLFGANAYQKYQTTDLPPFKLREVKVLQDDKLLFNWPLNEFQGKIANELVSQNNGVVTNPIWIKARHRNWQMKKELTVTGDASITFDTVGEVIYIITQDSLITYSINKIPQLQSIAYRFGRQPLVPGDLSLFSNNKLYYLYIDQMATGIYSLKDNKWNKGFKKAETNTGHPNIFFSKTDSSIYTIGGYGQLVYKDTVKRFNLTTNQWQVVKVKGDKFTPRYLAGLGTNLTGDTAYIIGGYGSASGQQIVDPRNLYDVMRFTVKDASFKKLFNINSKKEDFAFANSLVINAKDKTYYGLIFPQHKFNSGLQLIKGSLNGSGYDMVGDTIPYLFQDIHSFADLYYLPASNKFIAVTQFKESNRTRIKIYSLLSPPESLTTLIASNASFNYPLWITVICVIVLIIVACIFIARQKKVTVAALQQPKPTEPENTATDLERVVMEEEYPVKDKNAIFLFGDLQLFTPEGNEITKYFTPLLKELFLVILLYSIKFNRGVTSEKLSEILWYDKSQKSARNNRSVNIAKLKSLLDKMGHCYLSKDTGLWKIDMNYNVIAVDYHNYIDIVSNKTKLNKQRILQLTHITSRGNFLSNIEYEWLDAFKSEVSNEIVDSYIQFANSIPIADDPEFLIKLSNDIAHFDPVNEEAMIIKCKALSASGKHSLAKNTFTNFIKEYKVIYGEDFKKDFHSIIE